MTEEFNKRYYITKTAAKELTELTSAMFDPERPEAEINNPKPLLERLGIRKPKSINEKLAMLFERPGGLIEQMYEQGEETPEDLNDLHIEEDVEPITPYEYLIMEEDFAKTTKHFLSNNRAEGTAPSDTPPGNNSNDQDRATEEQGDSGQAGQSAEN